MADPVAGVGLPPAQDCSLHLVIIIERFVKVGKLRLDAYYRNDPKEYGLAIRAFRRGV